MPFDLPGHFYYDVGQTEISKKINSLILSSNMEGTGMDQKKVNFYLEEGRAAVKYTRGILREGTGNYFINPKDPRYIKRSKTLRDFFGPLLGECLANYGPELALVMDRLRAIPDLIDERIDQEIKGIWNTPEGVKRFDHLTWDQSVKTGMRLKAGNCDEHAAICYKYLLMMGHKPRPVEIIKSHDHAYVILGRKRVNDPDPELWGDEVVVVDAYYDEVYHLLQGKLGARQSNPRDTFMRVDY